jgi:hypothetical protein
VNAQPLGHEQLALRRPLATRRTTGEREIVFSGS